MTRVIWIIGSWGELEYVEHGHEVIARRAQDRHRAQHVLRQVPQLLWGW